MSARYRITVEQTRTWGTCFVVHGQQMGDLGKSTPSLREAFTMVAAHEACRMAGREWALWQQGKRIHVQRLGTDRASKFRTWGEVARFLAAVADAGRKPLAVA